MFSIIMCQVIIEHVRVGNLERVPHKKFFWAVYKGTCFWPFSSSNQLKYQLPPKAVFDLRILANIASWSFLAIVLYISAWLLKWI